MKSSEHYILTLNKAQIDKLLSLMQDEHDRYEFYVDNVTEKKTRRDLQKEFREFKKLMRKLEGFS